LWLRTNLPETLHAPELNPIAPVTAQSRLAQARAHWRVMVLGLIVLAAGTIGSYTFTYLVTYAQATLHLPARAGFIAEASGNMLSIPAMLLGGWLSDRHGRWPVNVWGNLPFLVLIIPTFLLVVQLRSELVLIVGMTVLYVVFSFNAGSLYAALTESMPKTIRGSGFGTVYSLSIAAFGGTTQLVITWLIHITGSAMAPAWYLTGAALIGQIAYMLMRESSPVRLRARSARLAAAAA
jgi:MFS family permease